MGVLRPIFIPKLIIVTCQKAETLRTRLQLALFKVRTNQINKPFSRLEQPRSSSPELPQQPSSLRRTSPEGIVAAARSRATQQKKPVVRNLNALPIPTIVPTAYSARYMHVQEEEVGQPLPDGTGNDWSEGGRRSVARSRRQASSQEYQTTLPKTPMQLSSRPRNAVDGSVVKHGQHEKLVAGLTSSVVKGEAANGLLELMRAAAA